jgi:hypothetical protein
MVRHALKHIFQKPTPDIDAGDRTQQLRAKTIYAGTVDLAKTLANGIYKTYNGPYEVNNQGGNSNLVASRTYDDLLSITKGKVLLNQLPLNSSTQNYYQQNFAGGQMYEGNYNQFNPSFNFTGRTGCNNSVLVYDIGSTGFTGPASYDANGGFIGATGPTGAGGSDNNKHIFVDPNHCYYSDPCLLDASYTRFVNPVLSGLTGSGPFTAQQIISADQYRGFSYPMSNFNLTCSQPNLNQEVGPLFCSSPDIPAPNPPAPNPIPLVVAVGSNINYPNTIATSQDGITWSELGNTTFSANGFHVAWNGYTWVAVGNGSTTIATSSDGMNWIPRSSIFDAGLAVASNGSNTWVAIGQGTNTIANSTDNGLTWTGLGNTIFSSGGNAGVAYGSNMWVAVGEGTNTIATSSDGIHWNGLGNTILNQGTGVAYGSNSWVAVGGGVGNKIVTSSNGIDWNSSASGNSIFNDACMGIAWNGSNLWVAVGGGLDSKGRIATSSDGMNWISSNNGSTIFNDTCNGVAWNSSLQLWVAVGGGGGTNYVIATSPDGVNWIGRDGNTIFSTGRGVASN